MKSLGIFRHFPVLLLLTWLGVHHTRAQIDGDPVKVTIYLETLCPDSIRFVVNQLAPAWENLKEIMEVDFSAYGFVTETPSGDGYEFECQHGADECAGNIVVQCAKNYILDVNTFVDFGICLMSGAYPPTEGQACAEQLGVTWEPINTCAISTEGQLLLHEIGLVQNALNPVPDWMPWIIINDVFTQENLDEAQADLTGLICRTYQGTPPPACQ